MAEGEVTVDALVALATNARQSAYAPYSQFPVGAAVLTESGTIFTGANVENASFGLTICAERAAIFAAASAGERRIRTVAVVTGAADPTPPCGACRQVISEFGPETLIICDANGIRRRWLLSELLPYPFGPAFLPTDPLKAEQMP